LLALDFTSQACGLGREWEADLFGSDGSALEDARFVSAFVAFPAASMGFAFSAVFALAGRFSTACWRFREKRLSAVPARGVGCYPVE
jgi:hypothetical protein